jgi:hypothetical protein
MALFIGLDIPSIHAILDFISPIEQLYIPNICSMSNLTKELHM